MKNTRLILFTFLIAAFLTTLNEASQVECQIPGTGGLNILEGTIYDLENEMVLGRYRLICFRYKNATTQNPEFSFVVNFRNMIGIEMGGGKMLKSSNYRFIVITVNMFCCFFDFYSERIVNGKIVRQLVNVSSSYDLVTSCLLYTSRRG
mgnify:CR=1 FL=1